MTYTVEVERKRLRDRLARLDGQAEQLAKELGQVQDERGKIDYALTILERLAGPDAERGQMRPKSREGGTPTRRAGGTYEIAIKTVNDSARKWRVDELVKAMRDAGWDAVVKDEIETVRAALSRAVAAGEITRPEYGFYAPRVGLPSETVPVDGAPASAPSIDSPDLPRF